MDTLELILHGLVVIGCIYMGVREGGLGLSPAVITAMWPSVMGMYFLPANGSQIATVAFDQTGTTKIGKAFLNHSFMVPTLVFVAVGMVVGFIVSPLV